MPGSTTRVSSGPNGTSPSFGLSTSAASGRSPELGIARYRDLEHVANGERWTAQDRHAHQPEVRKVKRQLDDVSVRRTDDN